MWSDLGRSRIKLVVETINMSDVFELSCDLKLWLNVLQNHLICDLVDPGPDIKIILKAAYAIRGFLFF